VLAETDGVGVYGACAAPYGDDPVETLGTGGRQRDGWLVAGGCACPGTAFGRYEYPGWNGWIGGTPGL